MRICKLDAEHPGVVQYLWGQFPIFAIAVLYESHCLAEVQDGHTIGLVWQKCGLNPPLGFYHGKFNYDRR